VINILEEAGFTVDHYCGSDAIANFTEKLSEKTYGMIILRTHLRAGVPTSPSLKFQNTIIIAMGCNGFMLHLAENLVKRGVGSYIAWKNYVRLSRTDQAVIYLLEHLLMKKQTIARAVNETMEKLGPDTTYNTTLHYYPPEVGDCTVFDFLK